MDLDSATSRTRVVDACERGGSSIYATGSSPGFITDALPFALLSLQRRVELVEIEEFANLSRRDSPALLFELMGFGRPLESFDARRSSYLLGEFGPPLGMLMEAAGTPVEEWQSAGAVAAARHATSIVAGDIDAGSVAAQRTTITGSRGGADVVRFTANWYCTTDLEPAWISSRRAGACASVAKHHWTFSSSSRSRSRTSGHSPLRTPPTGR